MFKKIKKFFAGIGTIMTTPIKKLSFLQAIFKVLVMGLGIYVGIMLFVSVVILFALGYLIFTVILSFGGAIENGTNEAMGRNRRRY